MSFSKMMCLALALLLTLGLCACGADTNSNNNDIHLDSELPEAIFGTWYPHPEISDTPIEISSDGTCTIDGQTLEWTLDTADVASATLIAEEYYLHFNHLPTSLPLLSATNVGMAVKEAEIWNYITEWHNEETGDVFVLDLEELAQSGCNITFGSDGMTIEALENDQVTHTIQFFDTQATITFADGRTTVYYSPEGGNSGNHPGDTTDDPDVLYQQAVEDLQNVLAGGYMVDYVDSDGVQHLASGAAAMEKLYNTFVSLQNYMDVSKYLRNFQKIDNVLIQTLGDNSVVVVPVTFKYNSLGQPMKVIMNQSEHFGNYISYAYDENGNPCEVSVLGVLIGEPIFDDAGMLTGIEIEVLGDVGTATATLTYNSKGQITKAVLPGSRVEDAPLTSEEYLFYYDKNGRLIQSTALLRDEKLSIMNPSAHFYNERIFEITITEFQYDAGGRLVSKQEHCYIDSGLDLPSWTLSETTYTYDNSALTTIYTNYFNIAMRGGANLSEEELQAQAELYVNTMIRMFKPEGLVNAAENNIMDAVSEFIHPMENIATGAEIYFSVEYEYGSIYIYQADA